MALIAEGARSTTAFKSLADTWADTTTPHGKLMGGLAEFERSLISARTAAGRARAKANGVRFGRRPKLNAHQRVHALKLLDAGEPQSAVARVLGAPRSRAWRRALSQEPLPAGGL